MENDHDNAGLNAAASDAAEVASAGNRGKGADVNGSQGEAQESLDSWMDTLAGDTVAAAMRSMQKDEDEADPAEAEDEKSPEAKQKAAASKAEAKVESPAKSEAILPEDEADAETKAADDEEGGATDPAQLQRKAEALERDNFKARERNRELRAELEKKEARIGELERNLKEGFRKDSMPEGFSGATSEDEVRKRIEFWESELDLAEDHKDTGYVSQDANGKETEWTPEQVREHLRRVRKILRSADEAKRVIGERAARESKAAEAVAKKYPFVTDAESPRRSIVEQLEKAHPEIAASPDRLLLLGRLTVAKLIEDGVYEITRKGSSLASNGKSNGTAAQSSSSPARRQAKPQATVPEETDWAMNLAHQTLVSRTAG